MKKVSVFLFCIFLIFSISFVYAGFFPDLWNKITGKSVSNSNTGTGEGKITDTTTNSNTKPLCSDSDGGYNIFLRGICTDSVSGIITSANLDSCTNGSLKEFYCATNGSRCINAFGGCPSGYVCQNGACTNQSNNLTKMQTNSNTKPLCSDSDGGYNIFLRGICTDSVSGEITSTNVDSCTNGILKEFYCSSNISRCINAFGGCPSGYVCQNGACTSNDKTPPAIDVFNVSFGYVGNSSRIYLHAQAHDYESEMLSSYYGAVGPNGSRERTFSCEESICILEDSIYSPEPGLWNVTVSFTNNVDLTVIQTQSIYVPEIGLFGRIGNLLQKIF